MGETRHHCRLQQQQQQLSSSSSRLGMRAAGGGEIVEVQGGHIVRSTGRKDRHSKVCTAKGPRDRRVRLSAHTAIKFYDVQDRLGYDRPSKAVDWLIKNAKPAIDELDELPPWKPSVTANPAHQVFDQSAGPEKGPIEADEQSVSRLGFQHLNNPTFLPPSLASDVIADTIKSFFPVAAAASSSAAAAVAASASTSIHFQQCPPDLLSRTSSQTEDLRLSLQSFQDSMLLQNHHHHHQHRSLSSTEQALFSGASPVAFDTSSAWSERAQHQEMGRIQRMIALNSAEGGGGGHFFGALPTVPLLGQNSIFSQRGPLQSSYSPSVRGWADSLQISGGHPQPEIHHHPLAPSAVGFEAGGFSGFRIPERIQGDEEHVAFASKPSSASSAPSH